MNLEGAKDYHGVFPENTFRTHIGSSEIIKTLEGLIQNKRAQLSSEELALFEQAIKQANDELGERLRANDITAQQKYQLRIRELCE